MSKEIDITGQRFGRLVALKKTQCGHVSQDGKRMRAKWLCKCDCGNDVEVLSESLRSGHTKSCGCFYRDNVLSVNKTHGMTKTRIYRVWSSMKARCTNKNQISYKIYGGSGITVCDRWMNSFEDFFEDMHEGYRDDLTLDRIDYTKGYSPDNCRWATPEQQANNRSSNVFITRDGETKTIAEWCRFYGINISTVTNRRCLGWDEDRIFDPPRKKGN